MCVFLMYLKIVITSLACACIRFYLCMIKKIVITSCIYIYVCFNVFKNCNYVSRLRVYTLLSMYDKKIVITSCLYAYIYTCVFVFK